MKIALLLLCALTISVAQGFWIKESATCEGRCFQSIVPGAPCQCNIHCARFNDCCPDFSDVCMTCKGRCGPGDDPSLPCQCNSNCKRYNDCCPDYDEECGSGGGDGPTDSDLKAVAEELLALDVDNNAASLVQVDAQGKTGRGGSDNAPDPLLTVDPAAYEKETIKLFLTLTDNYDPDVRVREEVTEEELAEEKAFLDAIFATPIMQRTQEFLTQFGFPSGRENFYELWFDLYGRGGGSYGSCGFEHVFMGEINGGGVSGFHNWIFFAKEEAAFRLDYNGYMESVDMAEKGSVIEHTFDWNNRNKPITSMWIGSSPEFEMAVYTICFHSRPDAKCPITVKGYPLQIQTWTLNQNGKTHIGSAYPDLS